MGLYAWTEETETEAWCGAYSAFNRWRQTIAEAAGYAKWDVRGDDGVHFKATMIDWDHITEANLYGEWSELPSDPLLVLIAHSDCDGEIHPEHAGPLAERLEDLLPKLPTEPDGGHIRDWRATTQKFIDALKEAAESGQKVMFADSTDTDRLTDHEIANVRDNLTRASLSDAPWEVVPNYRAVRGLVANLDRALSELERTRQQLADTRAALERRLLQAKSLRSGGMKKINPLLHTTPVTTVEEEIEDARLWWQAARSRGLALGLGEEGTDGE